MHHDWGSQQSSGHCMLERVVAGDAMFIRTASSWHARYMASLEQDPSPVGHCAAGRRPSRSCRSGLQQRMLWLRPSAAPPQRPLSTGDSSRAVAGQ